ncbi:hypothetical protein S83_027032 [Arachis hypogaea]|nr:uncharacterized protein LOC112708481 [Arachis hypogaea]
MSEEEFDPFSIMKLLEVPLPDAELFAADVGPSQFQSPSSSNVPLPEFPIGNQQPQPLPPLPLPLSLPQPQPLPPLPLPEFAANVPLWHFPANVSQPQFAVDLCGYQQPQAQPETVWSGDENKEFDMGAPQFQWPSEFQSLPLHHPVWTGDENHNLAANVGGNQQPQPQLPLPSQLATDVPLLQFAANVGGNQPPQLQLPPLHEFPADVCGYQQPQAQPEPVWSEDENKQFEIIIAECLPEEMQNRWEAVAACLPGKTPEQIQERFQELLTDINLIHKSYINLHHTSIAPAAPPTTLERNPLSLPGTIEQNQPANTNIIEHQPLTKTTERKKTVHWTQQEKELFLRGYKELGRNWKRISEDYVKTRTKEQVASHAQKVLKKLAEKIEEITFVMNDSKLSSHS